MKKYFSSSFFSSFFFFFLLSFSIGSVSSGSLDFLPVRERILPEDIVVFRLSGQFFTLRDLQNMGKSFVVLKCFKGQSYLQKFLGISSQEMDHISSFSPQFVPKKGEKYSVELLSMITLEKLKHFSVETAREYKGERELEALKKTVPSCGKLSWGHLNSYERTLLLGEVYLREYYGREDSDKRKKETSSLKEKLAEFSRRLNLKEAHEILHFSLSPSSQRKLEEEFKREKASP